MIGELSYQSLAMLAAAGVLATVVNVMAGGGGMIVLPVSLAPPRCVARESSTRHRLFQF